MPEKNEGEESGARGGCPPLIKNLIYRYDGRNSAFGRVDFCGICVIENRRKAFVVAVIICSGWQRKFNFVMTGRSLVHVVNERIPIGECSRESDDFSRIGVVYESDFVVLLFGDCSRHVRVTYLRDVCAAFEAECFYRIKGIGRPQSVENHSVRDSCAVFWHWKDIEQHGSSRIIVIIVSNEFFVCMDCPIILEIEGNSCETMVVLCGENDILVRNVRFSRAFYARPYVVKSIFVVLLGIQAAHCYGYENHE